MKRRFRTTLYLLLGLALLAGTGCQARATPPPTPTPSASAYTQPKSVGADRITALGTVRPGLGHTLDHAVELVEAEQERVRRERDARHVRRSSVAKRRLAGARSSAPRCRGYGPAMQTAQ